ncbi:MAG: Ltp family lipoprotein [Actinomycetaceae bacterium]|nr:Ltp family lipoprotein [Actinomycetaceae bacterium]
MANVPPPLTPLSSNAKKPFYRRWPFIALSGVLVLGFLGNLGNSGASDTANATPSPQSSPQATSVSTDEAASVVPDGATAVGELVSQVSKSASILKEIKKGAAPTPAKTESHTAPTPAQEKESAPSTPVEAEEDPAPVAESAPAESAPAPAEPAPTESRKSDIPADHRSALNTAETYSDIMHMSKAGIYNQLTSKVEQFTPEAAQYAVDNIQADWNANALATARNYQDTLSMSPEAIRDQLTSEFEGFTEEEADYAITHLND